MERPDLDEFLAALDGFLSKPSAAPQAQDSGTLKFLEIFCRSVGASEGHLLKGDDKKGLTSFVSFGLGPQFNQEFDSIHSKSNGQPGPHDIAYRDHQVVALIDIEKEEALPAWFSNFMKAHKFRSLVAVPLLNQDYSVGVLCAYYNDVCLFDKGTMDRLLIMGRMVGGSMEKNRTGRLALDELLAHLGEKTLSRPDFLKLITKTTAQATQAQGLVWGHLDKSGGNFTLTVVDATHSQAATVGEQYPLPPAISGLLNNPSSSAGLAVKDWGALAPLAPSQAVKAIAAPMKWQGQVKGCFVAWRPVPFSAEEIHLLQRHAGVAAALLNAAAIK